MDIGTKFLCKPWQVSGTKRQEAKLLLLFTYEVVALFIIWVECPKLIKQRVGEKERKREEELHQLSQLVHVTIQRYAML